MLGLVLGALTLRLYQLGAASLWYDELLELDIAQGAWADIGPQLIPHAAMPLDYYLLHGWILFGRQEMWVRWPALFFGVLAVPLTFTLARRLFTPVTALLAALLLAISPFAVRYSQESRPYALLLCCTLIAFWGVWQAYRTGHLRYWAVAIAGLSGAALSHYFAIFLLLPLAFFGAIQTARHSGENRYWAHLAAFTLAVLIIVLIFTLNGRFWLLYSVGQRFTREAAQPELYTLPAGQKPNGGDGPPLTAEFVTASILAPLSSETPGVMGAYLFCLLLALVDGLHRRSGAVLLLFLWLVLPTLSIYLFLLHRGTFFAERYILYTLPPFLLLTAHGGVILARWGVRSLPFFLRPSAVIAAGLALVMLAGVQLKAATQFQAAGWREDWRAVGQLLAANAAPDDAVIAVKAESALNWYYPAARIKPNSYHTSQAVWAAMAGHPRRWFVLSSYSYKRDQGLRAWLHQQGAVKMPIDRRIVVYFLDERLSPAEMLAAAGQLSLPPKAEIYIALAEQFAQANQPETSRSFSRRAAVLTAAAP